MPGPLTPQERMSLYFAPQEVQRRLAHYTGVGREWERQRREGGGILDVKFALDAGARVSELEAEQDFARLAQRSQPDPAVTRLIAQLSNPTEAAERTSSHSRSTDEMPTTIIETNVDAGVSGGGFFPNENSVPQAPSNLNPIADAAQFFSIFDEMKARQRAEEAERARVEAERPARDAAQLAERQRSEVIEMARWTVARFAETCGNIAPTLPKDSREALLLKTLLGTIDTFTAAPPAEATHASAREPS